ncbi:type II toxin-antitoxin system VapB family antitoxin [Methylopila sp. 73B]|uniref:type II toxin-antitoxin system VapB family antitoxin n=1 Tax=Methylopila sp. 73B TaxID=1120792 RepID=UPI000375F6BA|nr:type II toxin-antitoxin system VapB family antitoxin [Methylopila sp. 73B]
MAFHVRDPETDRVVRKLAAANGTSLTEAIRRACEQALVEASAGAERERRLAAIAAIQQRVAAYPDNPGVVLDKAFWDSLNDE